MPAPHLGRNRYVLVIYQSDNIAATDRRNVAAAHLEAAEWQAKRWLQAARVLRPARTAWNRWRVEATDLPHHSDRTLAYGTYDRTQWTIRARDTKDVPRGGR